MERQGQVENEVPSLINGGDRTKDESDVNPVAQPSKAQRLAPWGLAGGLCCLGCCGVTVLLAVIMVPVAFYSIIPNMAQNNLNKGKVEITNSTVIMPTNLTAHPWILQESHITMHSGAPFASTMKKFNQTMYAVDWRNLSWFGPSRIVPIGHLEFPEQTLYPGENNFVIKVNVTVDLSHDKDCYFNKELGWTCFFDYQLYMVQWGGPAGLMLQSDDVKIETLGISVPGKFKTNKTMTCHKLPSPEVSFNVSLMPECQYAGGCQAPRSMACNSADLQLDAGIDTTTPHPRPFGSVVV